MFVSLGTRLTIPVVLLVAAVAAGAYFGLVRTSRVTALRSKEAAADMVVKLTALSVMPAVVFNDEVEMKRAVDDLARNPEVTDIELWGVDTTGARSEAPLASHHRKEGRALGRPASIQAERSPEGNSLRALEPIKGPEGTTVGMLAVRMSTAREAAALAALSQQVLWVSLGTALCLAGAILVVLRRMVVNPLRRLEKAARGLAQGAEREQLAPFRQNARFEDEVVHLSATFGDMADAVRDREARLARRNQELVLILDSVDQGFLTARPDGTLLPERSAILATWLGTLPEDAKVWDIIERIDPASRAWMEAAWQQVVDGLFPLDAALEQLPKRLVRDGCHFDFAYHPVLKGAEVEQIVIVVTDVTAEVERQKALAEQHEFSVLVDQFVRDRRGFHDFWNEACSLIRRIVEAPDTGLEEATRRDLHTLKGNARFFGLTRLAAHCHTLEDAMRDRGENMLTGEERAALGALWDALRRRIEPLMNGSTAFLEISEEEYKRLVAAVHQRDSAERLEELVRGLRHEPTAWRLNRARETLLAACKKLGKSAPEVSIVHNELRLPPGRFAPFWSVFSHLISNSADHGLETDDQRKAAGKALPGKVKLSTSLVRDELVIEISDDGRGIDWERVRAAAEARGMPHRSQKELELALMSEGFSLKTSVSELSGRGVGLSAVRSVVTALGGKIEIESQPGKGSTWRFRLPAGKLEEPIMDPPASATAARISQSPRSAVSR
jgi:signal transduction histidine kinase/HAMP domain-containing protein